MTLRGAGPGLVLGAVLAGIAAGFRTGPASAGALLVAVAVTGFIAIGVRGVAGRRAALSRGGGRRRRAHVSRAERIGSFATCRGGRRPRWGHRRCDPRLRSRNHPVVGPRARARGECASRTRASVRRGRSHSRDRCHRRRRAALGGPPRWRPSSSRGLFPSSRSVRGAVSLAARRRARSRPTISLRSPVLRLR